MSFLYSIDPGLRGCGVAVFGPDTKELLYATYAKNPVRSERGPRAWIEMAKVVWRNDTDFGDKLTIEVMQFRPGRDPHDPNDTMEVQGVVGAIAATFNGAVVGYTPQWKGTVNADVFTERILERLSGEERVLIEPCASSLKHNVVDAIGIGLYHLGRLKPRRAE